VPMAARGGDATAVKADDGVVIGYVGSRLGLPEVILGEFARLRSGTILYKGTTIGDRFETGHNVIVRELSTIGNDVSIWSNTVVDYGCIIEDGVKVHANCYVAQYTTLESKVFLAPGVVCANDLYPGSTRSAEVMSGPHICAGVQVGVNATILPFVTIGEGALIGAGSVVTRDIPAHVVAYGSPATPAGSVAELEEIDDRIERVEGGRFRLRQPADLRSLR
jgi:acetyltransferase-like isoleucine patch superfamily enzyme